MNDTDYLVCVHEGTGSNVAGAFPAIGQARQLMQRLLIDGKEVSIIYSHSIIEPRQKR